MIIITTTLTTQTTFAYDGNCRLRDEIKIVV